MRLVAVVVCFRAPSRAIRAARGLAGSVRPVDGVVVVDNGGADTAALRAALPAANVVATERNLGFAGGANAGIAAALASGADAVLLLNDDAALEPDAVGLLEAALGPGVALVGPTVVDAATGRVESQGLAFSPRTGRLREVGRGAPAAGGPPRDVDGLSGCALLASRAALEALGPFDPGFFFYFEDLELCLRARRAGWRVVLVPAAVARHEGSATIGRRAPARLYHATRGHLRLGRTLGGSPLRQAAIVGWNLLHAVARRRDFEPGAVRAVLRGALDHALGVSTSGVRD